MEYWFGAVKVRISWEGNGLSGGVEKELEGMEGKKDGNVERSDCRSENGG
jgi:hypothetical protein